MLVTIKKGSEDTKMSEHINLRPFNLRPSSSWFKLKPFISFLTAFSFVVLSLSGIILYARPEGSLARWISWEFLGLDKSGWEAVHIVFCGLFVVAAVIHLALNFKTIVIYLRTGLGNGRKNWIELAAAGVLVVALVLVAIWRVPPASWMMEGRANFKNHPRGLQIEMPSVDFEKQSLQSVAECLGFRPEIVLKKLEGSGLRGLKLESSLEEVARQNGLTPQELYLRILAMGT